MTAGDESVCLCVCERAGERERGGAVWGDSVSTRLGLSVNRNAVVTSRTIRGCAEVLAAVGHVPPAMLGSDRRRREEQRRKQGAQLHREGRKVCLGGGWALGF